MPTARSSTFGVRGSGGSGDLRQGNLTSILHYVRDHGSSSRHDIAQGCGLGISTMTDLIGELRSRRLVMELEPIRRPAAGRPTRPIALDGEPWCALGLHITAEGVQSSAATVGGREIWSDVAEVDLRGGGESAADAIRGILAELFRRLPADKELLAVEVAVPGYVSHAQGVVGWSAELGWRNFPLRKVVQRAMRTQQPRESYVGSSNDTHLAALYAARSELRLPTDSVAVYLGGLRSLAGGLIVAGEVFRGANGAAGDIGHVNVDPGGAPCWCGRVGCLETAAGLRALLSGGGLCDADKAAALVEQDPVGAAQQVRDAAAAEDPTMLAALTAAGAALGRVIDDLVGTLNPHTVILGGYLGSLGGHLSAPIQERVALRTDLAAYGSTRVVVLDRAAPRSVRGAVLAARDACLHDPLRLTRVLR